jgi:hypothetical protein
MNAVLHRFFAGLAVALVLAVLSGCAVTTGAGQGRLAFQPGATDRHTVCTGVYASRFRERAEAGRVCRRSEAVRVIL